MHSLQKKTGKNQIYICKKKEGKKAKLDIK